MQLSLHGVWQRRRVAGKQVTIEPVVNSHDIFSRPFAELFRKSLARNDRDIGPVHGPPSEPTFDQCVDPKHVISPLLDIAIKIGRYIERVSRQKYLRQRRVPEGKVPSRNEDLRTGAPPQVPK